MTSKKKPWQYSSHLRSVSEDILQVISQQSAAKMKEPSKALFIQLSAGFSERKLTSKKQQQQDFTSCLKKPKDKDRYTSEYHSVGRVALKNQRNLRGSFISETRGQEEDLPFTGKVAILSHSSRIDDLLISPVDYLRGC